MGNISNLSNMFGGGMGPHMTGGQGNPTPMGGPQMPNQNAIPPNGNNSFGTSSGPITSFSPQGMVPPTGMPNVPTGQSMPSKGSVTNLGGIGSPAGGMMGSK